MSLVAPLVFLLSLSCLHHLVAYLLIGASGKLANDVKKYSDDIDQVTSLWHELEKLKCCATLKEQLMSLSSNRLCTKSWLEMPLKIAICSNITKAKAMTEAYEQSKGVLAQERKKEPLMFGSHSPRLSRMPTSYSFGSFIKNDRACKHCLSLIRRQKMSCWLSYHTRCTVSKYASWNVHGQATKSYNLA